MAAMAAPFAQTFAARSSNMLTLLQSFRTSFLPKLSDSKGKTSIIEDWMTDPSSRRDDHLDYGYHRNDGISFYSNTINNL
jgi:hypothetical protein